MSTPAGYLFDLEGTLYQGDTVLPGAVEVIRRLTALEIPFGLVTNTTSKSRTMIVARLAAQGISVTERQVVTAPRAAAALAVSKGWRRVSAFLPAASLIDVEPVVLTGGVSDMDDGLSGPGAIPPDGIIVGDLGARWSFGLLQEAFTYLRQGAGFIACSRDRYFRQGDDLVLDAGPFVTALEYASGATAQVAGKPSRTIFDAAFATLGLDASARRNVVMVGDDIRSDIGGATDAGLTAWAVRTGKFSPDDVQVHGIRPARILTDLRELLADLPG